MTSSITPMTFQVAHVEADEIYLTGDFNRWSVPGIRMKRTTPGHWESTVEENVTGIVAAAVLIGGRVAEVMPVRVGTTATGENIEIWSPRGSSRKQASTKQRELVGV